MHFLISVIDRSSSTLSLVSLLRYPCGSFIYTRIAKAIDEYITLRVAESEQTPDAKPIPAALTDVAERTFQRCLDKQYEQVCLLFSASSSLMNLRRRHRRGMEARRPDIIERIVTAASDRNARVILLPSRDVVQHRGFMR